MGCQGGRGTLSCVLGALLVCALVGASAASASISVGDVQVAESGTATFTITRNAGFLSGATSVDFDTVNGSAVAGQDYARRNGTLEFGSAVFGATQTQYVAIAVVDDAVDEPGETFKFVISGSEGTDSATATIDDNDPTPSLSVGDVTAVREGVGANATFGVQLTGASSRKVTLAYTTVDGSATAGQDYGASTGTVEVAAGSKRAEIVIDILDDALDEPAETFGLQLSVPSGATRGNDTASATIVDDDEPPAPPAPDPKPAAPATTGSGQPSSASTSTPPPATSGPVAGSTAGLPALGLSAPRLKRPSTVLVTISCPQAAGRCNGRVTVFSIANLRSRVKALRKERKLGRLRFSVPGGRAQTLSMALGRTDVALLRRTGRMRVRAYATTQDSAGRTGVRTVSGTLIARTAHSSPSS